MASTWCWRSNRDLPLRIIAASQDEGVPKTSRDTDECEECVSPGGHTYNCKE